MKFPLVAAFHLVLALAASLAAEDSKSVYLGSIVAVTPPAEWRAKTGSPSMPLDPKRDRLRPLYSGNQIRCGNGGRVVVELLLNRTNELRATAWNDIPNLRAEFERRRIEQWQSSNTITAGRTRGQSPGRRALLVGINTYEVEAAKVPERPAVAAKPAGKNAKSGRSGWTNLDGCLNDVDEMRAILMARFGFESRDILVLTNAQASRAGILDGIRRHLIEPSRTGDTAFFFFAGHGSQLANSLSDEADKMDETIVPADSALGASDIRDKELRRLFNAVAGRGAMLTAIFDSCHSGSIARGFPMDTKKRSLEPDLRDIQDDSDPGPLPSSLGALVISAALPTQEADEGRDAHNLPHGAFSVALFAALRGLDPRENAERIFIRAKAGLQTSGRVQEPVFDGSAERLKGNLLGEPSSVLPDRITVALLKVGSASDITLQGGLAVGLYPKCELKKVSGSGAARLRVSRVEGVASARAELVEGSLADLRAGDLFELARWTAPDAPILRLSVSSVLDDDVARRNLSGTLEELRRSARCVWVEDPTEVSPTHVISWNGRSWELQAAGASPRDLGTTLDAKTVFQLLPEESARTNGVSLFVNVPPSPALRKAIALGQGTANDAIEVTRSPEGARYLLLGRLKDGRPEYAWVAPNLSAADSKNSAMPARTDWFAARETGEAAGKAGESLTRMARRLGRIKAWLDFPAPADEGRFPYHLALTNLVSRELKTGGENLKVGEKYELRLRADAARAREGVAPRYVYVFIVDNEGKSSVLFPVGGGNNENRVPYETNPDGRSPPDFALRMPAPLDVTEPVGVDTYILLTSDQPLPTTSVLEWDGVRSRGVAGPDPLSQLLTDWGSGTRGAATPVPKDWSVKRLTFRTVKDRP